MHRNENKNDVTSKRGGSGGSGGGGAVTPATHLFTFDLFDNDIFKIDLETFSSSLLKSVGSHHWGAIGYHEGSILIHRRWPGGSEELRYVDPVTGNITGTGVKLTGSFPQSGDRFLVVGDRLYWADDGGVWSVTYPGLSDKQELITDDRTALRYNADDGFFYFTNQSASRIDKIKPDGTGFATHLSLPAAPLGLTIDPANNVMFYGLNSDTGNIYKSAFLSPSHNATPVITNGTYWNIVCDPATQRLYGQVDAADANVREWDYDGTTLRTVNTGADANRSMVLASL